MIWYLSLFVIPLVAALSLPLNVKRPGRTLILAGLVVTFGPGIVYWEATADPDAIYIGGKGLYLAVLFLLFLVWCAGVGIGLLLRSIRTYERDVGTPRE